LREVVGQEPELTLRELCARYQERWGIEGNQVGDGQGKAMLQDHSKKNSIMIRKGEASGFSS
jgi:hypothetical protein